MVHMDTGKLPVSERPCTVHVMQNDHVLWSASLPMTVTGVRGNAHWMAVTGHALDAARTPHLLLLSTHSGRRLFPPWLLGAAVCHAAQLDNVLAVLLSNGDLLAW